jgi:hypothetical protein
LESHQPFLSYRNFIKVKYLIKYSDYTKPRDNFKRHLTKNRIYKVDNIKVKYLTKYSDYTKPRDNFQEASHIIEFIK